MLILSLNQARWLNCISVRHFSISWRVRWRKTSPNTPTSWINSVPLGRVLRPHHGNRAVNRQASFRTGDSWSASSHPHFSHLPTLLIYDKYVLLKKRVFGKIIIFHFFENLRPHRIDVLNYLFDLWTPLCSSSTCVLHRILWTFINVVKQKLANWTILGRWFIIVLALSSFLIQPFPYYGNRVVNRQPSVRTEDS